MGAKGDGSFFQRNGAWVCQIVVRENGRSKRKAFYGKTKGEVQRKRDEFRARPPEQEQDRKRVYAFLDEWLQTVERTKSPATLRSYRGTLNLYVKPFIGARNLRDVTGRDIDRLFSDLRKSGHSTRTEWGTYVVLRAAFNQALKYGDIDKNPVKAATKPTHVTAKFKTLSLEQARQFLNAARGDRLYALYVLALSCGFRQGELFGLQWDDVDLRTGKLHVRRQAVERGGAPKIIGHTKTKQDRTVMLPPDAILALREHRKRALEAGRIASGTVFTAQDGGILRKSNFLRRSFFPLLKKAGCPRVRFHDLRHSCATLLFKSGERTKVVQTLLGHASAKITLDVYVDSDEEEQAKAAETMQRLLFG